jgi:hypothetical protein
MRVAFRMSMGMMTDVATITGISGVMLHVAGDAINSEVYFPRHAMSRLSYSGVVC